MELKIKNVPLICIAGVLVIGFYCIFTLISIALYPKPWTVETRYLSDFGSIKNSPNGWVFYVLACILTGMALFHFYIGLSAWELENRSRRILLKMTQLLGCCSAFALIMIGVYSDDFTYEHLLWGDIFFTLNTLLLIITGISLYNHPKFKKGVAFYGFGVAVLNLLFLLYATRSSLIEWYAIFTALGDVALIVYNTYNANK